MKILNKEDIITLEKNGILKNNDPLFLVLSNNDKILGELVYHPFYCWRCCENYNINGIILTKNVEYSMDIIDVVGVFLGFENEVLIRKRKLEILNNL